jgi:tetratricopeptide (TPR) repeat protein
MGNMYCRLGDFASGKACFEKVAALRPDLPDSDFCLGNVAQAEGRWDDAVACYNRAIAKKGDFYAALRNMGYAYLKMGQNENARGPLLSVLKDPEPDVPKLEQVASLSCEVGMYDVALAILKKCLEKRPDSPEIARRCQEISRRMENKVSP